MCIVGQQGIVHLNDVFVFEIKIRILMFDHLVAAICSDHYKHIRQYESVGKEAERVFEAEADLAS